MPRDHRLPGLCVAERDMATQVPFGCLLPTSARRVQHWTPEPLPLRRRRWVGTGGGGRGHLKATAVHPLTNKRQLWPHHGVSSSREKAATWAPGT